MAIIGPNGSGKTTFFNLIMQLYDVTSGAIYLGPERRDIVGLPSQPDQCAGHITDIPDIASLHQPDRA